MGKMEFILVPAISHQELGESSGGCLLSDILIIMHIHLICSGG